MLGLKNAESENYFTDFRGSLNLVCIHFDGGECHILNKSPDGTGRDCDPANRSVQAATGDAIKNCSCVQSIRFQTANKS